METLSFGINRAPKDKTPQATRSPIDQSPAAHLTFHDREHLSTIVNSAPRRAFNCSRSNGNLFTLPWNPCSRSRGNTVHHRVEYALECAKSRHQYARNLLAQGINPCEMKATLGKNAFVRRMRDWEIAEYSREEAARSRSTEEGGSAQADEAVNVPSDIRIPRIASSPNNRSSSVSHGSVRHFE
jgi:hypothetical protein